MINTNGSPTKVLRVKGCTLIADGDLYVGGVQRRVGPAECSCGEKSEPLPTRAARQAWHALHKLARRAATDPPRPCHLCHDETPAADLNPRDLCQRCADGEDFYQSMTPAEWAAEHAAVALYADDQEGM